MKTQQIEHVLSIEYTQSARTKVCHHRDWAKAGGSTGLVVPMYVRTHLLRIDHGQPTCEKRQKTPQVKMIEKKKRERMGMGELK